MPAHSVLCLSYPTSSRPSFAPLPAERGTWNSVASATIQGHVYVASTCLQGHVPVRKRSWGGGGGPWHLEEDGGGVVPVPAAADKRLAPHRAPLREPCAAHTHTHTHTRSYAHTTYACVCGPATYATARTLRRTHTHARVWPHTVRHCANPAPQRGGWGERRRREGQSE